MTTEQRPSLLRLGLISALLQCHFWLPVWMILLLGRGVDLVWIVVADTYFHALMVGLEVPMGVLGDRLGRRRTYLLGVVCLIGAYLLLAATHGPLLLFACWTVWAVGLALVSGTDTAYYYEAIVGQDRKDEAVSLFGGLRALGSIALLVSLLTAGWLYELQASLPLVINAGCVSLAALLLATAPAAPPRSVGRRRTLRRLRTVVARRPGVWPGIWILAVLTMYYWTITLLIQPLLVDLGMGPASFGPAYVAFSVAGTLAALASGSVARRLGRGATLMVGAALLAGGVAVAGLVPGRLCLASLPLMGAGFFLADPVTRVALNDLIPDGVRASALSVASLFSSLMLIGSRPLVGFVTDGYDAATAFAVWAVLGVPFLWGLALLARRMRAAGS